MNLKSSVRNRSPEDVYKEVATTIVFSALKYRTEFDEKNHQLTANAGAEFLYFLLHLVDRDAFSVLGPEKRNEVFDEIVKITISDYCKATLRESTPQDIKISVAIKMMDDMNDRQETYARCQTIFGISRGSMVFALGYFIHRALGRTTRQNVEDILAGEKDVTPEDSHDFPDPIYLLNLVVHASSVAMALELKDAMSRLK